jgi:hypothetical protein
MPDEDMSLRIRQRIAEGSIVIVKDKPNKLVDPYAREYRLLTGEEARRVKAEPAGPVTRVVYHPATPEDERGYQLEVQTVVTDSPEHLAAQQAAAEAAEEKHAAITNQQVELEKAAQADKEKAAKDAEADAEDDPYAEHWNRTLAVNHERAAAMDESFMEREKERQKIEAEGLKYSAARAKASAKDEDEDEAATDADEAFMAQEAGRQKIEDRVQKEREVEAKEAAKAAEDAPVKAVAGTTSPYIAVSDVGAKAGVGVTPGDIHGYPRAKPKARATSKPKAKAKASTSETPKSSS